MDSWCVQRSHFLLYLSRCLQKHGPVLSVSDLRARVSVSEQLSLIWYSLDTGSEQRCRYKARGMSQGPVGSRSWGSASVCSHGREPRGTPVMCGTHLGSVLSGGFLTKMRVSVLLRMPGREECLPRSYSGGPTYTCAQNKTGMALGQQHLTVCSPGSHDSDLAVG